MLTETRDDLLIDQFRAFIASPDFPCVGAKAAMGKGQMEFLVGHDITSTWDDVRIWPFVAAFAKRYQQQPALFQTAVIIFDGPLDLTEDYFERALWARLQSLADKDSWMGEKPDPRVSSDPDDPHFSLSFGGEAFFVVGLHPGASRPARRFAYPTLVFNVHDQFEQLRVSGRYEKLRTNIIERDIELAGSANPMLARHGDRSEAAQYSGRAVDPAWRAPFKRRDAND